MLCLRVSNRHGGQPLLIMSGANAAVELPQPCSDDPCVWRMLGRLVVATTQCSVGQNTWWLLSTVQSSVTPHQPLGHTSKDRTRCSRHYISLSIRSLLHIRPQPLENSGSRPISYENLASARLVVRSVTTSEYLVLYVFLLFFGPSNQVPILDNWYPGKPGHVERVDGPLTN